MTETNESGPKFSPFLFKAILVAIMAMAFVVPLGFVAMPYLEFFNGMAVQRKAKAQGTYGHMFGEKHLADFQPVAGTIPRGYVPHPEELSGNEQEQVDLAGKMLTNPVEITMETLLQGQKVYNIYCIACHGQRGEGDGAVVGPDRYPAPTSLHDPTIKTYPDGSIYQVITNGKGKMMGYADKIEPGDRWAVVHYVRVLQRALDPKPEDLP